MKILFIVNGATSLSEMLPLADYFRREYKWDCQFVLARNNLDSMKKAIEKNDFNIIEFMHASNSKLISYLDFISQKCSWFRWLFYWKTQIVRTRNVFASNKIDAIALYGDFNLGNELPFIKVAREVGIPSVVLPIAISNPDFMVKHRIEDGKRYVKKGLQLKILKLFFPRQLYKFENKEVLFYPVIETLRLWASGILPKNVWYMGGGDSSHVLVQSNHYKEFLIKHGVSKKKIYATGQFSHDMLAKVIENKEQVKKKIFSKYSFDDQKKLIVLALPQFSEHNLMSRVQHDEEIKDILVELEKHECNVLLSLHPKMNFDYYKKLENNYCVKISEERLNEVLGASDYFIACFESTIKWAIMLGLPTMFLNYFKLGYDLSYLKSIVTVTEKNDFSDMLNKFIKSGLSDDLNIKEGENMGFIDGKCGERIANIFIEGSRK